MISVPRKSRTITGALATVLFGIVASSCSTVINDTATTEAPSDTVPVMVTTTIPSGDITTLMSQLVSTANGLGEAIANRQTNQARQQASDAQAIWSVLQPRLIDSGIDVVEDIDRMVELMNTAVDRKRPADADKAFRFISIIAEELPALL